MFSEVKLFRLTDRDLAAHVHARGHTGHTGRSIASVHGVEITRGSRHRHDHGGRGLHDDHGISR